MKDLIKEIEGLKVETKYENDGYLDGINEGVDKCLDILSQHNIITAPKSIKLSEVLGKIDYDDIQIKRDNHLIFVKNSDGLLFTIDFNKLLPGRILNYVCYGNLKWLYTLWIVGTEIVDDLKEEITNAI